jgi:ech hydrogenase subunit E
MTQKTVIPFGPQHPVLPEPLHLDLVVEDETVLEVIPRIGFIHRGLERLVQVKDYNQMLYIAERICGICSFGHSYGYSSAAERLMNVEVPMRAEYLRVIYHEMSRIHSHLLWLCLSADGFGFEALFMHCWRLRERVLDIFQATVGGRVILSASKIGGFVKDIENSELQDIVSKLHGIEDEYKVIVKTFLEDKTVRSRLEGVGYISKEDALALSMVGPFGRASGVEYDVRSFGMGAYSELSEFSPIISTKGDCYARCEVRCAEVYQSIAIIDELVSKIPDGPVFTKVKGNPEDGAKATMLIEQPRGECFYYLEGNGTKNLERMRVRTPTNINLAGMTQALSGCNLADVPNIILTIDPCISCTER